jgi:hypothetical protein
MNAAVGDRLVVHGHRVGQEDRRCEVIAVQGRDGQPPYRVRWSDGHEGLFFPSSDSEVERPAAGTGG